MFRDIFGMKKRIFFAFFRV